MQKRALTINFERSVNGTVPSVMEVAVAPLSEPNSPSGDATLVGGPQTQSILLNNTLNPAVFDLVPTDYPDLTTRVTYRIAWREKYMGRQFTKDFVMPDFDVNFDDLEDLGNIIDGTSYLQWTDRSHPGGVAGLNDAGQVIDSEGNPVSGAESAGVVQGNLDAEIVNRQMGDNNVRSTVLSYVQDQVTQIYSTVSDNLNTAVAQLQNADTTEKAQRQAAVVGVNNTISALQTSVNAQVAALNDLIDETNGQFATKADLVNGLIPSNQLPNIALGHAVPVADQAAMLALTSTQVQPGDFAVRPDGVWFLNANPASTLGNWVQFTVAASVFSINGQTGAVVLSAADVGARSLSTPVPLAEVSGLGSALAAKTDTTTTTTLSNRVTAIETDASYVKRVGGLILRADMPADVVFVNSSNLIIKKDGTVLDVGGGGELDIADVGGLQDALDAKLASTDPAVTNARTPLAHKASHATGGTDALTPADIGARATATPLTIADITGLTAIITDNGLSSSSNLDGRIASAEGRIEDLELGGGGGGPGAGASGKTVWFSAPTPTVEADFGTIELRSPFGFDGTDYYYDPAGVDPTEAVYPYVSAGGHLKFITRNEANPADEPLATQDALDTLAATVALKADQADLDLLTVAVDGKASLSALSTLQASVDLKATIASVNSLTDIVNTKAAQSSVDGLTVDIGTKAAQSDLAALTTHVNTDFYDKTGLDAHLAPTFTGITTALGGKEPAITGGTTGQYWDGTKTFQPLNKAAVGLANADNTTDAAKPLSTAAAAALATKADLDGTGKVPTSQLPSLSFTTATPVANRGAMLALTSTQVQPGDVVVITATADKGSYILNAVDPSVFTNWVKLVAPDDAVQSVNGQSGTVVLAASDVGARSSAALIPQSDVSGLGTALAAKADTSVLTSGLAAKTSTTDVQTMLTDAVIFKQKADLVAATAVASPSGQQSVDGVLAPLGAVVLLTAQSSSVNNGLWIVASGAWTRVSDMTAGSYFVRGTVVVVTSGAANANTVWQETNASGVVATNANNWTKILTAGAAPVYTGSSGVKKIGLDMQADVATGGGIIVSGGLRLDPNIATRKFSVDVPAGSTTATITHGLNTSDVQAQFRDKASGVWVVTGWMVTGVNTISVEFGDVIAAGQYRVVVTG